MSCIRDQKKACNPASWSTAFWNGDPPNRTHSSQLWIPFIKMPVPSSYISSLVGSHTPISLSQGKEKSTLNKTLQAVGKVRTLYIFIVYSAKVFK